MTAPAAEVAWVETPDHAWIALHHRANPGGTPVILCHGISSNHHFWDLTPETSLSVALWEAGFDVWNLDLRGHGEAERDPGGNRQKPGWRLDDYGVSDLPSAIRFVQQQTGAAEVEFVGHSLGGMVLAITLATWPDAPIAAAAVVGSPLDFHDPDRLMALLFAVGQRVGLRSVPTPAAAQVLGGPFGRMLPLQSEAVLYNPDNFDRAGERAMLAAVVSPLTSGEIRQFSTFGADGEFRSADGAIRYRDRLAEHRLPMLFVAGRADHVVTPDRVAAYADAVGSPDETFWVLSEENGYSGDYGHLDFGCAPAASREFFPPLIAWLAARAPAKP